MTALSNDPFAGFRQVFQPVAFALEGKYGLPSGLLDRLIASESSYNPKAVGDAGKAIGIAQFHEGTAKQYSVDRDDAFSSMDGAARYLNDLKVRMGTWSDAVAKYKGFSDLSIARKNKTVIGVVGDADGTNATVSVGEDPIVSDSDKSLWRWGVSDYAAFFKRAGIALVLFIIGLSLIIFTLYAVTTRGRAAVVGAAPELAKLGV